MKNMFIVLSVACFIGFIHTAHAQTAAADNKPYKTNSRIPLATGPSVLGVFEGRFPCQEIARQLKQPERPECVKIKWGLTLYQDPVTHAPTRYKLEGGFYSRDNPRTGTWTIVKGTKANPDAIVYQLDPDLQPQGLIMFLKGDDNVLFILDENRNLRVGDGYLSYTMNRAVN